MDNTQTQKTVQSFKITNIRQLDHEGMVTETDTPVTRQQIAKVLSETILGVDIEQFEDYWAGNLEIDINVFDKATVSETPIFGAPTYFANVYKVETDEHGMTSQGECIADFDIELFTDRNDSRRLLECEGCGLIFTLGELESTSNLHDPALVGEGYFQEEIGDFHERITPGEVVPFGEHFWNPEINITEFDSENYCGLIHEFDYSKLVKNSSLTEAIDKVLKLSTRDIFYDPSFGDEGTIKALDEFRSALGDLCRLRLETIEPVKQVEPEQVKVLIRIEGGILVDAKVENGYDQGKPKVEVELWDIDNIGRHGRATEAKQAWEIDPGSYRPIEVDTCRFDQPAWIEAYRAWPEAAFVTFRGHKFPFTEINGVKIGCDNLNTVLLDDGEHVSEEAREIDDQFGYYVPFEIMMQGDKATWEYIKKEIDEDFAGGSPE